MNFIAGRLAATEGAYFLQESKHAVGRLSEKKKLSSPSPSSSTTSLQVSSSSSSKTQLQEQGGEGQADVLHEILRHSLPIKPFNYQQQQQPSIPSMISTASKWRASPPSLSPHYDTHNPLKDVLCLPQVTFGPKRWNLPGEENSMLPSTANELRRDKQTYVNPEMVKAAEEGLSQIGKALAIATTVVFGGATLTFMVTASKLQVHNISDIRTKGRDLLQPRVEIVREQVGPLRDWAEQISREWHYKGNGANEKQPIIIKELSKQLGVKTPN